MTERTHTHTCAIEGCEEDAPFGTGVSLLNERVGTWHCFAHWRARKADEAQEAARPRRRTSAPPEARPARQGVLL